MGYTGGASAAGGVATGVLAYTGGSGVSPAYLILAAALIAAGIIMFVISLRRRRRDRRAVGIR